MNTQQQQEAIRKSFEKANGIVMLEGWKPDAGALARQERVISGELSHLELVHEVVRLAKEKNKAKAKGMNESYSDDKSI